VMHVPFSHQLVIAETEDPIPPICHPIMRGSVDKDFYGTLKGSSSKAQGASPGN
jgi:hypothetical protein